MSFSKYYITRARPRSMWSTGGGGAKRTSKRVSPVIFGFCIMRNLNV